MIQAPVVRWMAWSINPDNGAGGDPAVWDRCRLLWSQNGIAHGPWLHCHTMADIERLLDVGEQYASPFIGLNIEDVFKDFTSKGISLMDVAQKLARWQKPIHMATLPWVQNGQGWKVLSRCVAALEIFPDEQTNLFPGGVYNPTTCLQCIGHAFEEGLSNVTLMLKTKLTPGTYGQQFTLCHSLYTADDITPTAPSWKIWQQAIPCTKPAQPPVPDPEIPEVRFTRVLSQGDVGPDCEGVGRALCKADVFLPIGIFNALPLAIRRRFGFRKVAALVQFKKKHGLGDDPVYGKRAHLSLSPFFDARAKALMEAWEPPPPPLIAPKQGFSSLVPTLWEAYSLGRRMGLTDLGTYNPNATLPSGGKSDHAFYPALAFDLGFSPQIGFNNLTARAFFNAMVENPAVEYVILGDKIWSQDAGLHPYVFGGHQGHVHTSARR